MCVTVWVLRYKNKKNGDRGTIVFTATLKQPEQGTQYDGAFHNTQDNGAVGSEQLSLGQVLALSNQESTFGSLRVIIYLRFLYDRQNKTVKTSPLLEADGCFSSSYCSSGYVRSGQVRYV